MSKKGSEPNETAAPVGEIQVSLCHLRLELGDLVPPLVHDISFRAAWMPKKSAKPPSPRKGDAARGARAVEEVSIETYAQKVRGKGAQSSSRESSLQPAAGEKEAVPFFSGNPFVEKTEGILHLYKRTESTNLGEGGQRSLMLCMIAIPTTLTSQDLLQFLEPVAASLQQMRIIRTASTAQFMMLLTFRDQGSADAFFGNYNGIPFNSLEAGVCHLVYVADVESDKELVVEGAAELPTCPVCLERMEESVDGILTILCNHAFHAQCLLQWADSSCPVCRYVQSPEADPAASACAVCARKDDLWICLICGHVGCGRYAEAHAHQHFQDTTHTYSLQVGTQRVWDYAGDNYVHRLIQTKEEGKVVEFEPPDGHPARTGIPGFGSDEKVENLELEFTHLLTSQLDSQRKYFESKLEGADIASSSRISALEERVRAVGTRCAELESEVAAAKATSAGLEKRLATASGKLATATAALSEESALSKALGGDQAGWREEVRRLEVQVSVLKAQKEREVGELQEQVRDMMFHFEAQEKLKTQVPDGIKDEVSEGHLEVAPKPSTPSRRKKK